jgi:hypothetical protein
MSSLSSRELCLHACGANLLVVRGNHRPYLNCTTQTLEALINVPQQNTGGTLGVQRQFSYNLLSWNIGKIFNGTSKKHVRNLPFKVIISVFCLRI